VLPSVFRHLDIGKFTTLAEINHRISARFTWQRNLVDNRDQQFPLWGKSSRDFAIAQGASRGKIHAILEIAATKRKLLNCDHPGKQERNTQNVMIRQQISFHALRFT